MLGWIAQANRSPDESGLRYRMTNASTSTGTTIAATARVNGYVRSEGVMDGKTQADTRGPTPDADGTTTSTPTLGCHRNLTPVRLR
jgi:hypothetical protein